VRKEHTRNWCEFYTETLLRKCKKTAGFVALHNEPGKLSSEGYNSWKLIIRTDLLERQKNINEYLGRIIQISNKLKSIFPDKKPDNEINLKI
jgi:hypothetical protein